MSYYVESGTPDSLRHKALRDWSLMIGGGGYKTVGGEGNWSFTRTEKKGGGGPKR